MGVRNRSSQRASVVIVWAALFTVVIASRSGGRHCSAPSSEVPHEVSSPSEGPDPLPSLKLPRALAPLHYNLTLRPHLTPPWLLEGSLGLHLRVVEETDSITLNMADIVTLNDSLKVVEVFPNRTAREVPVLRQEFDQRRQMYTAVLGSALTPGSFCNMSLQYQGLLNDKLVGFYRSQYITAEGETRWLATSHFAPTDARRAFPCYDEPDFKSTFAVTIVHHPTMTALSNMPLENSLPISNRPPIPDGHVESSFATTPPMSTYLVAFHVSDLSSLPAQYIDEITLKVWSRREVLTQAEYANNLAPLAIEFFKEYFQMPFPLPKLDLVAVPELKFTGMENWGLSKFRESVLLLDRSAFSPSQQLGVALQVVHEIAHQWIGNLVTPFSWSELWLKEGLVNFLQYIALDAIEPGWSVTEEFLSAFHFSVMPVDSFHSSLPVQKPVGPTREISEGFDRIAYQKGAALLRMVYNFVGPIAFRDGLRSYLKEFKYKNANQDDLWRHLTATGASKLPEGVTVKAIMNTWTSQKGYPVVNVTRTNYSIILTQEPFLLDGCVGNLSWWVPVSLTTASDHTFGSSHQLYWMENDSQELLFLDITTRPDEWVAANLDAGGYFRVDYSPEDWNLLSEQLQRRHQALPPAHRAALINDAFSLAWAGRLNYSVPLSLVKYLREEMHHVPWENALADFNFIYAVFHQDKSFGLLQEYLLMLVTPWYERLGFEDSPLSPHCDRLGRESAVQWACRLRHPDCVAKALRLFDDWITQNPGSVDLPGHVRTTLLCQGVAAGGRQQWDAVWQRYLDTTDPAVDEAIVSALGCTKEVWLLARYLDLAFSENSGLRKHHSIAAFTAVADNPAGRDLAWRYLRTHWADVVRHVESFHDAPSRLLEVATRAFTGDRGVRELAVFEREQSGRLGPTERGLQQVEETARLNAIWWRDHYGTVTRWLEDHSEQLERAAAETTATTTTTIPSLKPPTKLDEL